MERRSTPRVNTSIPATLTTLIEQGGDVRRGTPVPVTVEEISGHGARILCAQPLRPGELVQLETDDDLFLGEVCHTSRTERGWVAGVELDCALHAASSIRAMMRALLDQSANPSGSHAPDAGDERHHQHRRQSRQQNPA